MDKNSNYWFTAIYAVAFACYLGIFYPEIDPIVALFESVVITFIMMGISYILYK